jgi:hypothetical protein
MPYAVGIVLALAVAGFARWSGFDRDRAFYPTTLIVVASYYVLFAALGGTTHVLVVEALAMAAFVLAAVGGFKLGRWLAIGGLAAHGAFDLFHPFVVDNAGVPQSWPAFCLAFDVGLAAILALAVRAQPVHDDADAPERECVR